MEGKITLPLIYALQHCNAGQEKDIRQAIEKGDLDQLHLISAIIKETQAAKYCQHKARYHAELAVKELESLPDNPYKQGLLDLVDFVVYRNY